MFDVFDKKQMYDSAITWKENASKDWNYIISMFLTSSNIYFVFGYACFISTCFKTAIWLCLFFLRQGLVFFKDRLAALDCSLVTKQL